jgi:hypothetical protein
MNRIVLGAVVTMILLAVGLFWLQGRAEVEQGAPPPEPVPAAPAPDVMPSADISGMRGAAPPEATELTREQRRFFRYDRNRDLKISRNEMLSSRTAAFRRLDTDGNNLITFEEFAVATADRFDGADKNGDGWLSPEEFATTAPAPRASPSPRCNC